MADLETYVGNPQEGSRVVQCALVHYQFETIHPFGDGNGRVGRLLIILQLISLGLLTEPLTHPSVYFEKSRLDYYDRLQAVRDRADWVGWINYFAQGIIAQCRETIKFTQEIRSLQQALREQVRGHRAHASIIRTLEEFMKLPIRTVAELKTETGLSHNTVQAAIDALTDLGMVREITGKKKGRAYLCKPVYNLVFYGDAQLTSPPL